MELLTASLLRATHGFPTRQGGVSRAPFDSLNASRVGGDEPHAVDENLRRLAAAARAERIVTVNQVHGTTVVRAAPGSEVDADAVWTDVAGVSVGVRTADCVPVLIEDVASTRVAAVHAGWRGIIGAILTRTIERLAAEGSRLADLRLAIGPCIQACCFEVDGELPSRFSAAFGASVVVAVAGKRRVHLNLPRALQLEAARLGVGARQVHWLSACTHCNVEFFSHRREKGVTGRHLSFITSPASPM